MITWNATQERNHSSGWARINMKIKFPWFTIEAKRIKRVKAGPTWCGGICNVCGEKIPGAKKSNHMLEMHPQYQFSDVNPKTGKISGCRCTTCGKSVGTIGNIAAHYREFHPDKIKEG
jgi:hypothetical protein